MRLAIGLLSSLIASGPAWAASTAAANLCHVGVYRLQSGGDVDIGQADEGKFRWRRKDGTTGELTPAADGHWASTLGWTGRPDGTQVSFSACGTGEIEFNNVRGKRLALAVTDTRFNVEDAVLAGRLVLPEGKSKVPIVVLVHGSENDSARDSYALQRLFPSEGIGAFVYDKRGTGESTGRYTQSYLTLADDAIAAMREAKRLAGDRLGRIGYHGGSQGGWVAPLAARIEPVDFVVVGFGLAVSPLEEDRLAIALDMTRHGYAADVMAKAMRVADAAAIILSTDFREGYDQLEAVRKQYGTEPWFRYVRGDVTWLLLQKSPAELRDLGPKLFAGIPVHYDPMPVLRNLTSPQLWILGADDVLAPSAETASRLRTLAQQGHPISVAVFPHADHGILEYETAPDGTRTSTRQSDGYFEMMRDFILNGRLSRRYGSANLTRAAAR